jgi:hypothetical protein
LFARRERATPEFPLGRRLSSAHRFPLIPRRGIARSYSHHQSDCCRCRTRGAPVYQQEFAGPEPHARARRACHIIRDAFRTRPVAPLPPPSPVPTHRRDAWCTGQPGANPTPRCFGRVRTRRRGRASEVSRTGGKGRARLMISRSGGACRARHRRDGPVR